MSTSPSRRWRALTATLVATLVVGGCSALEGSGVEVEASPAAVGDAAARTVGAGSAAFEVVLSYEVTPSDEPELAFLDGVDVAVSGRYDVESGRVEAVLDPDSRTGIGAGVVGEITTITDPETGSLFVQEEEDGGWVRWDLASVPPDPGGALSGPVQVYRLLELVGLSSAEVTADGQADVRGVDTAVLSTSFVPAEVIRGEPDALALRSLTGQADLATIQDQSVPVELYVADDRTIRRLVATFDLKAALAAGGATVSRASGRVQLDLGSIGSAEPIELPTEYVDAAA